jgi:hypothetical protein
VIGTKDAPGPGSGDIWVLKLNSNGTIAWQKSYGGDFEERGYSIQQTSDGGFIVAGTTENWNAVRYSWLLKLNYDGTIAWQKVYDGIDIYSIIENSKGGFVTAGRWQSHVWIMKLRSDGSCPPLDSDTSISPNNTNASVSDTSVSGQNSDATITITNAQITDTNATINQQAP